MKPTRENAITMIRTYDWSISQLSDISTYGPPTRNVYYWQLSSGETREEYLYSDLERRQYWIDILENLQ